MSGFEGASVWFGVLMVLFGTIGAVAVLGDEGVGSVPFAICAFFVLAGSGRVAMAFWTANRRAPEAEVRRNTRSNP